MSVDAHDLERAALQRKDREQLQAIAQAMGRKPPSRARKDQIIELILEAAGLPTGGGASSTPAAEAPAAAPSAPERVTPETPRLPFDSASPPAPATAAPTERPTVEPASAEPATSEPVAPAPAAPVVPAGSVAAAKAPAPSVPEQAASRSDNGDAVGGARPDVNRRPVEAARAQPRSEQPRSEQPRSEQPRDELRRDDQGRDDRGLDGDEHEDRAFDNRADHGEDGRSSFGDPNGEREGGSRRRRRRGRDKDRGERSGVAGFGPGGSDRGDDGSAPRDHAAVPQGPSPSPQPTSPDAAPAPVGSGQQGSGQQGSGQQGGPHIAGDAVTVAGHLDLREEGYGFLRVRGYLPSKEDVYVPAKYVRQFSLRKGDQITGISRPAGRGEKNPALLRVDEVNGADPELARVRPRFEDLTPLFPDTPLRLSRPEEPFNMTARIVDLISPIGKGQRGLIVSPPKAGKTTIMKTIAQAIEANNPEVKLIILLVDERPEEVTDMRRSVRGEVVASTFDRPADEHTHVAEMTIERAKRLVESGHDVVIILDGITRLARAYNIAAPATGRVMSGGIDTGALYPPKKFFGAARNVEEGGSLTILATALVETGSRMDEVIFEEFKGTGNMELRLDRRLAEKRIYPAIDVDGSSTRHEELLFDRRQLQGVWRLRRVLSGVSDSSGAGLELLIDRMKSFKTNDEFLAEVAKAPSN